MIRRRAPRDMNENTSKSLSMLYNHAPNSAQIYSNSSWDRVTKQPSSKQFKIVRYSNLDYQAKGGKTVYVLPKVVIFLQTDLVLNNIGQMITKDHILSSNIPWARIRTNLLFDVAWVWNSKIHSVNLDSVTQTPIHL